MSYLNMMYLYVILLYISNSAVCGEKLVSDDVVSRIIFGANAPIEEYPFFARIISRGGEHLCGATIISDRWLLTAAHCIFWDTVYVVGDDEKYVEARLVIKHPQYKHSSYVLENDIALVRLASRLQFSDKVQSIKLPTSYEVKELLLGLGRGMNEHRVASPRLMKVDLMEVDVSHCAVERIKMNQFICATRTFGPFPNVCQGDSGSPLVSYGDSNATLVGIVSYTLNTGTAFDCWKSKYSAFVKIAYHVPWIQQMMHLYDLILALTS